MSFEIGGTVQFERERGEIITGTVTSIEGREPNRAIGVCGPGLSENYLYRSSTLPRCVATRPGVRFSSCHTG